MKTKKLVLDTKKPLGNPNSLKMVTMLTLALSIGVEYKVAPHLLSSGNYTALVYPLLLNIIPLGYPAWKWIKLHIIDYKIYKRLMSIVHSEQLIDYGDKKETTTFNERKVVYGVKLVYEETTTFNERKVVYGVKLVYEETTDGTYITVYPNGIKHSDATQALNSRLEETFNMNVLSVDHQLSYTKYLLRDVDKQQMGVTDNAF